MKHKHAGFTLIEVMIALIILATIMTAVFTALSTQSRIQGLLRDKSMGLWIAENVLTSYQLHLLGNLSVYDEQTGNEEMLNQRWSWHLKTIPTNNAKILQVIVQVNSIDHKSDAVELIGYTNM